MLLADTFNSAATVPSALAIASLRDHALIQRAKVAFSVSLGTNKSSALSGSDTLSPVIWLVSHSSLGGSSVVILVTLLATAASRHRLLSLFHAGRANFAAAKPITADPPISKHIMDETGMDPPLIFL